MYLFILGSSGSTKYYTKIRRPKGWGVNPDRPLSSRIALDNHVIHQTADKDYSSAKTTVTTEDTNAVGAAVAQIDLACSTVILGDGEHVYEAVFDAKVTDLEGRRKAIAVNLSFVRRIV